jgi:adenosine deaminase
MRDLHDLPKAHLHLHLEGGMRPSTLAERASHYGMAMPVVSGFGSFPAFADMYVGACDVLRTDADLVRLVDEVVDDAAGAGAIWIEPAFYQPRYRSRFGSDERIIELILDALAAAAARTGVGTGLMLAADRTIDPAEAIDQARLAARYANHGVVSFGLANDEALWPPEPFAEAFAMARDAGVLSTPHAGELAGPESIVGALDALGADRVQHGVRAIEDPALVQRLADEGVCLDVCPSSNVLLSVVPSIEAHPLPQLLEAGVRCSLNADDPLLFGPGLLEEYQLCRDELDLDDAALATIAVSSIEASGASVAQKAAGVAGVDAWLGADPPA